NDAIAEQVIRTPKLQTIDDRLITRGPRHIGLPHILQSQFAIGDKVYADGCEDLTVTAIQFRVNNNVMIECSWLSGGSYAAWIEEFRLKKAETQ
ncbi:MAG: hypothetical protein ACKO0Z_04575, partial [Betaproteobacteria bacterium]